MQELSHLIDIGRGGIFGLTNDLCEIQSIPLMLESEVKNKRDELTTDKKTYVQVIHFT